MASPVREAAAPEFILRRAVEAVLAAAEETSEAIAAPEDLRRDLEELERAVLDVLGGADSGAVRQALPARVRRPGLAAAVRRQVLGQGCDAEEEPRDVLALLRALDMLAPSRWIDTVDAESLLPLLAEPDAFELLVEVTHDLRSPLTSILFLSETLRNGRSGRVNDIQRSQLGLIYGAALGLHSVSSDLIDLARAGTEFEEENSPFTISEVFQSVVNLVRPVAEEKGLEIRTEAPSFDRCIGQPLLLSRVLLNLTTNGLKFTSEGYVELCAKREPERSVTFSVRDTGPGLGEDASPHLFEPFKKSDDRRGHFFSGAGLGLSIARRLVRRMGSELEHESRPGWGTRFFFTVELPRARRL